MNILKQKQHAYKVEMFIQLLFMLVINPLKIVALWLYSGRYKTLLT